MEISILVDSILRRSFLSKIKSYCSFWLNIGPVLKGRRKVQEKRKLRDKELFIYLNPEIDFQEVNSPLLSLANHLLSIYYQIITKLL